MLTPEEARMLPHEMTRRAIARWEGARAETEEGGRLSNLGDSAPRKWVNVAFSASLDAMTHLVVSILAWGDDLDEWTVYEAEKGRWPNRGVKSNGRLYLAVADPNREGEKEDEYHMMRLVVVEASAIVDLDGVESRDHREDRP